jgi:hypothetical protein
MLDVAALARSLVEGVIEALPDDSDGDREAMKFLVAVRKAATSYMDAIAEGQEHGPDQTGNIWPGCICNDARYELGHMETCPWYGYAPDRPGPDPDPG